MNNNSLLTDPKYIQKIKLLSLTNSADLDACCSFIEKNLSYNIIWEETDNPNKKRQALIEFPFVLGSIIDFERVIYAIDDITGDETIKNFCKENNVLLTIGSLIDPFGKCGLNFFASIKGKRIFELWIKNHTNTKNGLEISCTCMFNIHSFILSDFSFVGKKVDLIGYRIKPSEKPDDKFSGYANYELMDSVIITSQKFEPVSPPSNSLKAKFILRGYEEPQDRHFPKYVWASYDLFL